MEVWGRHIEKTDILNTHFYLMVSRLGMKQHNALKYIDH